MGESSARGRKAVKSKWYEVSRDLSKFTAHYLRLKKEEPSGWNEDDFFQKACELFHQDAGKDFPHRDAFEYVKMKDRFAIFEREGKKIERPMGVKKAKAVAKERKLKEDSTQSTERHGLDKIAEQMELRNKLREKEVALRERETNLMYFMGSDVPGHLKAQFMNAMRARILGDLQSNIDADKEAREASLQGASEEQDSEEYDDTQPSF
eukprot:scaffold3346_cov313-Pinguiococcus_pyrenoidosus.AAC.1